MLDLVNIGAEKLQLFVLLLMRIGGVMAAAPIFSHRSIPRKFMIAMSLGLAVIMLPLMSKSALPITENMVELFALCLKEILVGVLIGFIFAVIFIGIKLAGSIIGYQMGFAMVNVMDPNSSSQVSIIGELWYIFAILIFLVLNGHHSIISGLVHSFQVVPLGLASPPGAVGEWLIKYSSFAFIIAVKVAAPVMMTIFLVEVSMGVLARTMPQMNIFIVGFPLKIFTGLLLIALSLPAFSVILNKFNARLDIELSHLMKLYNVSGTF